MSEATISDVFTAPAKAIFQVLTNYNEYPKFLTDIKRASVIDAGPEKKLVEFELQIVKSFRYQLWLTEKPNFEVSWKFHSGDVFKENSGTWRLKELEGGKTQVDYKIAAKFGLFVPGMIEKKLIEVNLPTMMKAFKSRVEEL